MYADGHGSQRADAFYLLTWHPEDQVHLPDCQTVLFVVGVAEQQDTRDYR